MFKIKLNLLIILVISSFSLWGNPHKGKYKKTKKIEKTYQVYPGVHFYVSNEYGNINLTGWNKNTVKVEVSISVTGDDQKAVIEKSKQISIEAKGSDKEVSFFTHINSSNRSSWSLISLFFGKNQNLGYEINYDIKVPIKALVTINNEYGNIFIDELQGNLKLNADYGKLEIGELGGENNHINLDYFSVSHIDFIRKGIIKMDYSTMIIDKAYELKIIADYTKIDIHKVRKMQFSNDYGYIKVKDAMLVKGTGDYQTRTFENINSLVFSGDYGSIKIVNPKMGFDKIKLDCDYTNVKIINGLQASYRFNLMQDYGCFKYDELHFIKREEDGQERDIKAYYKEEDSSSLIDITADYGCIKIYNHSKKL